MENSSNLTAAQDGCLAASYTIQTLQPGLVSLVVLFLSLGMATGGILLSCVYCCVCSNICCKICCCDIRAKYGKVVPAMLLLDDVDASSSVSLIGASSMAWEMRSVNSVSTTSMFIAEEKLSASSLEEAVDSKTKKEEELSGKHYTNVLEQQGWLRTERLLYQQEEDSLTTLNTQYQSLQRFFSQLIMEVHILSLKGRVNEELLLEAMQLINNVVQLNSEGEGHRHHVVLQQMMELIEFLESKGGIDLAEVDGVLTSMWQQWSLCSDSLLSAMRNTVNRLEKFFERRRGVTDAYASQNTQLLMCMREHFYKQITALEDLQKSDKTLIATDVLIEEIEQLWDRSIKQYKSAMEMRQSQLGYKLRESIENDLDTVSTKLAEQLDDIVSNNQATDRSIGDCEEYLKECSRVLQMGWSKLVKRWQVICSVEVQEFSTLAEELGERYLTKLFSDERTLYSTFFAEQTHYCSTRAKDLTMKHNKDLETLKGELQTLRRTQSQSIRQNFHQDCVAVLGSLPPDEIKDTPLYILIQADFGLPERQQMILLNVYSTMYSQQILQTIIQELLGQKRLGLTQANQKWTLAIGLLHQQSMLLNMAKFLSSEDSVTKSPAYTRRVDKIVKQIDEQLSDLKRTHRERLSEQLSSVTDCVKSQIAGVHERQSKLVNIYSKQERALNVLKDKLMGKLAKSGNSSGEKLLQEHLLYSKQLTESMDRHKQRQEQLLRQKLQARQMSKSGFPGESCDSTTYQHVIWSPDNTNMFVCEVFIELLQKIRHRNKLRVMQEELYNSLRGLQGRMDMQYKLQLQLRQKKLVEKMATISGLGKRELRAELKDAVKVTGGDEMMTESLSHSLSLVGLV